jgi:hypothetical protein
MIFIWRVCGWLTSKWSTVLLRNNLTENVCVPVFLNAFHSCSIPVPIAVPFAFHFYQNTSVEHVPVTLVLKPYIVWNHRDFQSIIQHHFHILCSHYNASNRIFIFKLLSKVIHSFVLNRLLNFISERGSQNITMFGLYKIIIRLKPNLHYQFIKVSVITGGVLNG